MELDAVSRSYKRWAPIYDFSFGKVSESPRRRTATHVNARGGRVLEVGVGTGLSLPLYSRRVEVTGIDFSHEMLAKAREKVEELGLTPVKQLRQMDAREIDFPDETFDTVVAMFLVSVVPEPERVVSEMARVCKSGGEVVIVNHFAREKGPLAAVEKALARFENTLGWHSDFSIERVTGDPRLEVVEQAPMGPGGLFTFLRFRRR
ncbi:class I SAM-dependent methyltransferase [Cereibacter azotoformans]|uniref:Phosphatidylethanolamine N-methyltransferase /phosphatidyl-N-methylethanolamine N-methyltransferase n=2 Tax=Cereibacter TaxID=1653176 RepID=A0A2T5K7N1_9RHOB|nr:class I SAM-dependent methyltransferase [Cereibacter azotoformans]AXQ94308.1 class I SAM-dependent methyltransferase [Cereibacter sphaeroides]MBO4167872.1 class I SAM-dependent methyltransferase [Cereibacter azotoformans]PTR18434.1 phosphatidylethanolamine N-methyltransferase /phosphatidyl-N-methylethanolamine N-methyltransferase [Cereibacter azotoformans]UIJ29853.1 class I SAM-dependent methyltransferase [Cereibacter azotoformans]ULB10546.1 class I SAM-dependent methyltransferase [Cereibac